VPGLPLGRAHRGGADARSGHAALPLSIVTVTFAEIRGEPASGRGISRLQSCIRGSGEDRTMVQPCASTARFRGGGAHSLRRRGSHACLGSPPPRIVISARRCWRRALSSLGQPGVDGALTTRDEARRRAALRRS
jgi:hypothetical protein